jgi:hypothetical protein
MLEETLGILIMRYLDNPDILFFAIVLSISLILGFIAFYTRYFFVQKQDNESWLKLKTLDKIVVSLLTGLFSLIFSFALLFIYLLVAGIMNIFITFEFAPNNSNITTFTMVSIAFVYLFSSAINMGKNIKGLDFLVELFKSKQIRGFLFPSIIINFMFFGILGLDYIKFIIGILLIVVALIIRFIKRR